MTFANSLSGGYETSPYLSLYQPGLTSVDLSWSRWLATVSIDTQWLVISLNLQSQLFDPQADLGFLHWTTLISGSRSYVGAYRRDSQGLAYSPFIAARIEEAKTAVRLLDQFEQLEENWDGHGAAPISKETCNNARRFIETIGTTPCGLPMPEIAAKQSGNIALKWEVDGTIVHLEIGNTLYSGVVTVNGQELMRLQGRASHIDQQVVADIRMATSEPDIVAPTVTGINGSAPQYAPATALRKSAPLQTSAPADAAISPSSATTSSDPSAVVSKAVSRAADLLGLSDAALARTIGVSEVTVSRLRAGNYVLERGTKPYELALLLVRLFRGLDAMMAGDEVALRSWMLTVNSVLRGVPQDLVQTATGLVATADYVDAARARI